MDGYMKAFEIAKSKLEKDIEENIAHAFNTQRLFRFHTTQASLKHLLPGVLENRIFRSVYTQLLYNQALAPLDQCFSEKIVDIKYSGAYWQEFENDPQPKIYCTFHLGSYRAIIGHLARFGKHFTLAVDENVFNEQAEGIKATVDRINQFFGTRSHFEIMHVERFDAALQLYQQLRKGQSLVLFMDGNTGSGGVFRQDDKMQLIDFLGKKIFARKGIAGISLLSKAPIVPVISFREAKTDVVLHFFDSILPPNNANESEKFISDTTQCLFGLLEEKIKMYPLQWEGWLYVHKYLDPAQFKEAVKREIKWTWPWQKTTFNKARFGLFKIINDTFLFDYSNFNSFEIPSDLFKILENRIDEKGSRKKQTSVERKNEKELRLNGVLV